MSNVGRFSPEQRKEFKEWLRSKDIAPYETPPELPRERRPTKSEQAVLDAIKRREAQKGTPNAE